MTNLFFHFALVECIIASSLITHSVLKRNHSKSFRNKSIKQLPKLFSVSKKKFKEGLESLFGDPAVAGMTPFLVDETDEAVGKIIKKTKKRSSSKNFTSDLDSLFSDALDKEYQEHVVSNRGRGGRGQLSDMKKRADKPIVGLDALIRKTIEEKTNDLSSSNALKKRITITMEKQKIEKLKAIAKVKKAYIRDIIDDIVSEFIKDFKSQEGLAN